MIINQNEYEEPRYLFSIICIFSGKYIHGQKRLIEKLRDSNFEG